MNDFSEFSGRIASESYPEDFSELFVRQQSRVLSNGNGNGAVVVFRNRDLARFISRPK
jgi:hypothetical protein